MRIALVGPGHLPIPPRGWGAVEIVIHEQSERLRGRGHEVLVVNTQDGERVIREVNEFRPDFVNVHPEHFFAVLPRIECPVKAVTSHHPLLGQLTAEREHMRDILGPVLATGVHIFALSEADAAIYRRLGGPPARIHIVPNGVDVEAFRFSARPRLPDRSICLGRINPRKRQTLLQSYQCGIDFVGPARRRKKRWFDFWRRRGFDTDATDYLGEWTRGQVHERLTDYANLVLLSSGEAHSLAGMEALAAGLGLVITEQAGAHLDLSKRFIEVVPEKKIGDRDYVCAAVSANRKMAAGLREEIRAYARQFDWERAIDRYCAVVAKISGRQL